MQELTEVLNHLIKVPYLYYAVTTVVLLVGLYVVYSYRKANQGIIPFKTQGGQIEIAPSTIRAVMQSAANNVNGVEKATCRHFQRGRSVGVKVAIHLRANSRLRDVETHIKQSIRATLHEQFGMENIEPIHIRVTRIIGDPVASSPKDIEDDINESRAALMDMDDESGDDRPYADETRLS